MGAQTLYKLPLRDHVQDVNHLHVENATSGRRRGADTRGGRIISSEPLLELYADDSPSEIMADWPSWEPTNTSPTQQSSSLMVHSSGSQGSYEAALQPRTQDVSTSSMQPPAGSTTPPRSSLIETLQTVLNSNSSSPPASRSPQQLGTPPKPLKRRSRVSRRVPTIVLEATSSDFLGIVQRLTGVSASAQSAPAAPAAPVRPLPHRASPVNTFIRPDRPAMSNSSTLNFSGINSQVIPSNQYFSLSQLLAPRGFDGGSSSTTFATPSPIVATTPSNWWDSGPSNLIPPTVDHEPTSTPSGPENLIVLPEGSEFSLAQFDAWLSSQDDT